MNFPTLFAPRASAISLHERYTEYTSTALSTAAAVLASANDTEPGERLRRYERRCAPRGGCQKVPCERDRGRWTFCPDCLTIYDDCDVPVNWIREIQ